MYVEQLSLDRDNSIFDNFAFEFLAAMESAKHFSTVDLLISVISNMDSLKHFVSGLDEAFAEKEKLLQITKYDESYYNKLVASILPKLAQIKQ